MSGTQIRQKEELFQLGDFFTQLYICPRELQRVIEVKHFLLNLTQRPPAAQRGCCLIRGATLGVGVGSVGKEEEQEQEQVKCAEAETAFLFWA